MAFENILYLRQGELTVGPRVGSSNAPVEPQDAITFKTRINFNIEMDNSSIPNKAKISIFNLSEASRTFLEQRDLICFLNVGYESSGLVNLFFGDIDEENGLHVMRNGPDIITTIEAGDAEKTLRNAIINVGLSKGATNTQVINEAAKQLNVSTSFRTNIREITYQNGFSEVAQARRVLDRLGAQAGFEWSIQGGELIIVGPEETDLQEAVLVTSKTGLIGFPVKTQDKVEFTTLLNPRIRPNRAVRLESVIFGDQIGENIKVTKVSFVGDTREGPWFCKVEGRTI